MGALTVLVTGASGRLGRLVVPRLAGHDVRAAGRSGPVRLDLSTGEGLADAVRGVDVVLHLASSALGDPQGVDVEGTRRLVAACREAGVRHLVYPSIVGIHRVPMAYYRAKLDAERIVADVPHTLLRITQFHVFLKEMLDGLLRWPLVVAPAGVRFQPIDEAAAADALVACVAAGPAGRVADLGGPEVLELPDVVRLVAPGRWILSRGIPSLGPLAALRAGALCLDGGRTAGGTFADWLAEHVPAP